ncbi:MAG TPA: hypothetical protein VK784_00410, partial [Pseudonocardiaceae bacterium]|nr:hypothetical protein [Pseudonocardiaceae bacterium]
YRDRTKYKGANHLPHRITPYVQNNMGNDPSYRCELRMPDRCPDGRFAARALEDVRIVITTSTTGVVSSGD